MTRQTQPTWRQPTPLGGRSPAGAALLIGPASVGQARNRREVHGKLVYARSEDGITNGGVIFAPPRFRQAHRRHLGPRVGSTYYPTYVKIGRALPSWGGYACIASTRMRHRDHRRVAGET